jgi:hypothetical protein
MVIGITISLVKPKAGAVKAGEREMIQKFVERENLRIQPGFAG